MEPLQRIALVVGILASLATIFSFIVGLPDPVNYSLLAVTITILLVTSLWHRLPVRSKEANQSVKLAPAKHDKRTLYDKTFVIGRKEYEPFRIDCLKSDAISILAKADNAFNWYVLDAENYGKYEKGLVRIVSRYEGSKTINENKEFDARTNGPLYLVIENATKEDVSVNVLISVTHPKT